MGLRLVPGHSADAPGAENRDPEVWASGLCGRESIFLFSHTNYFCGK